MKFCCEPGCVKAVKPRYPRCPQCWYKNKPLHKKGTAQHRHLREVKATRPRPALCEVCNEPPMGNGKVLSYDHDHATGKFRGWLCSNCNAALGFAKDSASRLRLLADYLETHEKA